MFVQGVRDLQLADECKCRDILTPVGNLVQLALKIYNVGFEAVTMPHLYGEKVMVVPLTLPVRCVLGEEHFGQLLEATERM